MATTDEKLALIRHCQRDPEFYFRHVLREDPWDVQVRIIQSVLANRRTAVPSCHGSGKSWTAARVALWFLQCFPSSIVITTAPTNRQVENILWKEVNVGWRNISPDLKSGTLYKIPRLEVSPDWFAYGFSTDDPNNFQGTHAPYVLIVFDEACGIKAPIWEALEGNLSGGFARFLAIANPTDPLNPFFDECQDPSTTVIPISAYDTPNFTRFGITEQDMLDAVASKDDALWQRKINGPLPFPSLVTPDYAVRALRKYGRDSLFYLPRVLGQFPQQSTDALVWLSWVNDAVANWRGIDPDMPVDSLTMGVDVAGGEGGGDETAITIVARQPGLHPQQVHLEGNTIEETPVTMARVLRLASDWHRRYPRARFIIRIDADGLGLTLYQFIAERIRADPARYAFIQLDAVHSGVAAHDASGYANVRAEEFWGLRERFEDRHIGILDDPDQRAQLASIKYGYRANGQVLIESKKDAQKRGVKSPDRADALRFALHLPHGIFRPEDLKATIQDDLKPADWLFG